MSVQKDLVGAVTAAGSGLGSTISTIEKQSEKQEKQAASASRVSQVRSASEKARDSLNAAREEQAKKKSFSSSMKEKLEAKGKVGK